MAGLSYGGGKKPTTGGGGNFWDQLKSFAQKAATDAGNTFNFQKNTQDWSANIQRQRDATQRNTVQQQMYGSSLPNPGRGTYSAPTNVLQNLRDANTAGGRYAPGNNPYTTMSKYNPQSPANNPNRVPSYMLPTAAWSPPTATVLPDAYLAQSARDYDLRSLTQMPDSYMNGGARLAEQLTGYEQPKPGAGANSGAGGYGGYGYGGWGGGGGGGGGWSSAGPSWWMQMVNWNINRPTGG